MKVKRFIAAVIVLLVVMPSFCQIASSTLNGAARDSMPTYNFSVSTTFLSFLNFEPETTNVRMYELHVGYRISSKDKIELKLATWKLFAPMGIPLWDSLFYKQNTFYPGRLAEIGIGIVYQRMLWKGLYASVEILPLKKTYLNKNNVKIDGGFKLYTSYHVGYHIKLFKNRAYIEPQIHCNYWPINTKGPQAFEEAENKWNNFLLLEPNLYIGVNF
jgi:hypothetical protein